MAALTRQDRAQLLRGGEWDELVGKMSTPGSKYTQITAQDVYDQVVRPQEEAELKRRLAEATSVYTRSQAHAGGRNADMLRRMGYSGAIGARAGEAMTTGQGTALADRLAGIAAGYEQELNRPGRFAKIDELNAARQEAASNMSAFGDIFSQASNPFGGAMLQLVPGLSGPAAGALTAAGSAGWKAGVGGASADAGKQIRQRAQVDSGSAFSPVSYYQSRYGTSFTPQGSTGVDQSGLRRALYPEDEEYP